MDHLVHEPNLNLASLLSGIEFHQGFPVYFAIHAKPGTKSFGKSIYNFGMPSS
jgi:hypothetical protein